MDLFELLFIAIFIIIPILEGVLKQRRKGSGQGPEPEDGPAPGSNWAEPDKEPDKEPDPRPAADMLPDDLWEIMTGERRPPAEGEPSVEAPWSAGPEEAGSTVDTTPAPDDWREEPWVVDDEVEYRGPEAYSLETPAPAPIERRVPTPTERHRRFHELIDEPQQRPKRHRSPLVKALQNAEGLKQAVLLKEVLGPPKGLE